MGDIQFPVNIKDIEKFEKLNTDISINVLVYENDEVYSLRVTKNECRLNISIFCSSPTTKMSNIIAS